MRSKKINFLILILLLVMPVQGGDAHFIPGPKIRSPKLLQWLQANARYSGSRTPLQIPVVIRFSDKYQLDIYEAYIGKHLKEKKENLIFLALDDSTLGIPLSSRLTTICPKSTIICTVWVEGFWGPAVERKIPDYKENTKKSWPFTVLKIKAHSKKNASHLYYVDFKKVER